MEENEVLKAEATVRDELVEGLRSKLESSEMECDERGRRVE